MTAVIDNLSKVDSTPSDPATQEPRLVRVGIIGGTGYTGVELLRLLSGHPRVEIAAITSRGEAGRPVSELFPSLRGRVELAFSDVDPEALAECDVVFSAAPNGVAMQHAPRLLASGTRLIDLAADFRLRDAAVWERWYGIPHACPDLLAEAVYGLPEAGGRERIRNARLVANPGCYPTAVLLGLMPLLRAGKLVPGTVVADAKSGVSGAGRAAKVGTLHAEVSESFKAYGADGHRHLPEIRQQLQDMAGTDVDPVFVPHLVPMIRGIHATLHGRLTAGDEDLQALFERSYAAEPFVDVLPAGSHPETRSVRGSNVCRIAVHRLQGGRVVVLSVIDNLVKGAAGQAVQNMNLMLGWPESAGLEMAPLLP